MKYREIIETYSEPNVAIRNYLRNTEFDPHHYWFAICQWAEQNEDAAYAFRRIINGQNVDDIDDDDDEGGDVDLEEEDPDIFYKLPAYLQKEGAEWAVNYEMKNDPANAATTDHLSLDKNQLIPRSTWLIHFTDDAYSISHEGFTHGIDDMTRLGLTTYFTKSAKKYGGYNFAFVATDRHAKWAASEHKYGKDAVMFQSSGVHVYHYADEEDQVIFWGKDVKPRDIVLLIEKYGDWHVESHNGQVLFHGEFENAVNWVINNFQQYHKALTGF